MHALTQYTAAKAAFTKAKAFIALIGKEQSTTAKGVGKLHGVEAKSTIHYQPTDGAKNYHNCAEFDRAFSDAVLRNWNALALEAMNDLQAAMDEKKAAAAAEYEAEFGKAIAA